MSSHLSYDEVAYLSTPIAECDPHVMATIANLYGLETVDPSKCDVLDLGCGDGLNILSLASSYPDVHVVGYDPAEGAIARGNDFRAQGGIENAELYSSIEDGQLDGKFDYVMAHGVLTWIDDDARPFVIEQAAKACRPGALVNFSYRTYPYVHYELPAREMAQTAIAAAREQAEAAGEPFTWQDEVRVAKERVALAAKIAGQSFHGQIMASMVTKWENTADWVLYHDDLSNPLRPFRLTDVVEQAAAVGLTYVGELIPQEIWQLRLEPELADQIRELGGPNAAKRQQVCDDLIGNGFHSSLFVKSDTPANLEPSTEGLTLYARQYLAETPNGPARADAVSAPVAQVMRERNPGIVTAAEIAEELGRDLEFVEKALLRMHVLSLARLTTSPVPVPAETGEFPKLPKLTGVQLAGPWAVVASRFHLPLMYDYYARRQLLLLCDGTRDRATLRAEFEKLGDESNTLMWAEVLDNFDKVLDDAALDGLLLDPADA